MQEYKIQKLYSVHNARIQRLLKMCSIFQLHEQQMHLKKIDIVHPASKVFAVGDEGHNLDRNWENFFVSLKVCKNCLLEPLLSCSHWNLPTAQSWVDNFQHLIIYFGFPNMIKSICICTYFNTAFTCICPGAGHLWEGFSFLSPSGFGIV